MPRVQPFRAIEYRADLPLQDVIAPPYDVLDAPAKQALLNQHDRNVVAIDLPHIPPKTLGPPEAYAGARDALAAWLADGTLAHADQPLILVYRQTFDFAGGSHKRLGVICTVDAVPFGPRDGGGILPHEETFSGPKADRLALMNATQAQLSPIFGLHQDEQGSAVDIAKAVADSRPADRTADTSDGLHHEVWRVTDAQTISAYQDALAGEDIFVADGHHRYNTALNYINDLGDPPPEHAARQCMMVLASMSDPGLVIGPTHRVLAGMANYSWDAFANALDQHMDIRPLGGGIRAVEPALDAGLGDATNVLGLYDFDSRNAFVAAPKNADPLKRSRPDMSDDWRTLDVALIQELIVGEICTPLLNNNEPVQWGFPHAIDEILEIGAGVEKGSGGGASFTPQLAVIVRPTPLEAIRAVSRNGELMPQKSTFFYPKLATGIALNPLA